MGFKNVPLTIQEEAPVVNLTLEQGATWFVRFKILLPDTGDGLNETVRATISGAKLQIKSDYGGAVLLTAETGGDYLTMDTGVANEVTVTLEVPYAITTGVPLPTLPGRRAVPGLTGKTRLGIYDLEITVSPKRWRVTQGTVYVTPEVTTV
jgi:hypothetical protein